jgi:uncharacterized membrane protein (UPF0127 family)
MELGMRNLSATAALLATIGVASFASCGANDGSPTACPAATSLEHGTVVCFGSIYVHAELATTYAERQQGLMGRAPLPDTSGMLFVFAGDAIRDFWMQGTPSPLSIAFLDSARTIINIVDMAPNTETIHRSTGPARYALEVRQGWFSERGIAPGAKATFTLPAGLRIDP